MNDNKKINNKEAKEVSGGGYNILSNVQKVAGEEAPTSYYCETCKKKLSTYKQISDCIKKGHDVNYCK